MQECGFFLLFGHKDSFHCREKELLPSKYTPSPYIPFITVPFSNRSINNVKVEYLFQLPHGRQWMTTVDIPFHERLDLMATKLVTKNDISETKDSCPPTESLLQICLCY